MKRKQETRESTWLPKSKRMRRRPEVGDTVRVWSDRLGRLVDREVIHSDANGLAWTTEAGCREICWGTWQATHVCRARLVK